jgi:SAM-dependent methyltransferase
VLKDYLRILENPTSFDAILCFVQGGRQRAFPKIHHIRSTMFMEKQIEKCYRHLRNTSRLHFLVNNREIEDAGEEEFIMKKVLEEDDWEEEEEEDEVNQLLPQKRIFKKANIEPKQED